MEHATGPGGRYHDMMKKMQDTGAGKFTALTGTIKTLAGTIGMSLMPVLGKFSDFMNRFLSSPTALWTAAAAIGGMATAWGIYKVAVNGAAIASAAAEAIALWPIAAVGALAAGITYLCLKYESWGNSMKAIWEITKSGLEVMKIAFFAWADTIGFLFHKLFENIMNGANMHILKAVGDMIQGDKKSALHEIGQIGHTSKAEKAASERENREYMSRMKWSGFHLKFAALDFKHAWHENITKIHFDTKNPKAVKNPLDILSGAFTPTKGTGSDATDSLANTSNGITGGGVRNITINVAKFQEKRKYTRLPLERA
jgi:hypothetical protein